MKIRETEKEGLNGPVVKLETKIYQSLYADNIHF